VTRLRAGRPGSIPGRGRDFFLFATASRLALGRTQTPIQWIRGVERPEREADHSLPSSAYVKNACSYTSTPSDAFLAWYLVKHTACLHGVVVKHGDKFAFYLWFCWRHMLNMKQMTLPSSSCTSFVYVLLFQHGIYPNGTLILSIFC
jgi:hypothetical protein